MPPAPAPGGRVIRVDAPKERARKGGLDTGFLLGALAIGLTLTTLWRVLRRARVRQSLL